MATVTIEFEEGTIVTYEGVDDKVVEEITIDYFEGIYPYSMKV